MSDVEIEALDDQRLAVKTLFNADKSYNIVALCRHDSAPSVVVLFLTARNAAAITRAHKRDTKRSYCACKPVASCCVASIRQRINTSLNQ